MKRKNNKSAEENKNPYKKEYGLFSNILYLMKNIRRYRPRLPFLMAAVVITGTVLNYIWGFVGKFVIDIVQQQAASAEKDFRPLIILLLITGLTELICSMISTYADGRSGNDYIYVRLSMISERVAKAMLMNYQKLEMPEILDMENKASRATSSNGSGVEGLMRSVSHMGLQLFSSIFAFVALTVMDWRLILVLVIICVVQYIFFLNTVKRDKAEVWDVLSPVWRKINYMDRTTQDFDCAKDIRLFGMKDWLYKKQTDILNDKQEKVFHSKKLWTANSVITNGLNIISQAVIYAVLILSVAGDKMTIGNFTLYLGLTSTFAASLNAFLNGIGNVKRQSMEVDDYRSYLDLDFEEKGDFLPLPSGNDFKFEFKNVSFKYEGSDSYALKNVNLTLEPHKKLAIVGLNGAGKTTMIKLLLRLYDADEGEILLNGINVKRFKREEYYKLFSPVFQNVELFAFPFCENVSMATSELTDREKVVKCANAAGLEEKIASMPNGIDTELLKIQSEDGIDFSGGERQKLALARALYKNAPIVVLDEPTAALDALAEYQLYRSFDEIIGNKSAVYISHRLSSTRFCDSIAMFRDGELIEYGTHEELLNKKGAYADMFEIQAQYYKKEGEENE